MLGLRLAYELKLRFNFIEIGSRDEAALPRGWYSAARGRAQLSASSVQPDGRQGAGRGSAGGDHGVPGGEGDRGSLAHHGGAGGRGPDR